MDIVHYIVYIVNCTETLNELFELNRSFKNIYGLLKNNKNELTEGIMKINADS